MTEVTRDAPRAPQAPIDESVTLPPSVRAAAEKANAYYAKPPDETPPADLSSEKMVQISDTKPAAAPPPQPAQPVEQPVQTGIMEAVTPPATPPAEPVQGSPEWEHRYNSMKGRFEQSQQVIRDMQQQMAELSAALTTQATEKTQEPLRAQQPTKLVTDDDEENYGKDMIDLVRRAAVETVGPEINNLRAQNRELNQQVMESKMGRVFETLARDVPNWQAINESDRFAQWVNLRDIYSGVPRKKLLMDAFQAADAPRVVSFFKGFINDEAATGQTDLVPPQQQAAVPPTPPRTPAANLETFAAPGRTAKSPGSEQPTQTQKPVFTRAQITAFYRAVRAGHYAGREGEKDALEREIFSAQSEGRVR